MVRSKSVFFLCLLTAGLFLSPVSKGDFTIGAKGGVTLATVSTNVVAILKERTGFAFGAQIEFPLGYFVSLQPEILILQKGFSFPAGVTFAGFPGIAGDKIELDYVQLPLLLKMTIPFPVIRPYIFGGPAIALKTKSVTASGSQISGLRNSDFLLDLGGGIEIGMSPVVSLLIEARYSLGLIDINESSLEWKTRTVMIMGGFSVGI